MFFKRNRQTEQNNKNVEMYDPDCLVKKLSDVFSRKTRRRSGHVHFYFRNKSDHIILLWLEGWLDKILAKSANCKKGRYTHWEDSGFSNYKRQDILQELHNEIERVEIDSGLSKAWSSYAQFVNWLTKN